MKDLLEKFSVTELAVILFCGAGFLASIFLGQENIATAIGGGLIGYLGGVTTDLGGKE